MKKIMKKIKTDRTIGSRPKRSTLTAEQIHAELDRLCKGAPAHDAQAVLASLRG
jgi:hypothetical protein